MIFLPEKPPNASSSKFSIFLEKSAFFFKGGISKNFIVLYKKVFSYQAYAEEIT